MTGKTKVEFWGGYHGQMQPIRVWLDSRYVAESPLGIGREGMEIGEGE